MKYFIRCSILSLATAFLFAGCGKKSESAASGASGNPAVSSSSGGSATVQSPASGRAVEITANDTMKFSVTEIRAKRGEPLSITLVNVGTTPKFSMGHNWVLLTKNANVDAFANEAMTAAATDYIPASQKGSILAHTKLLGPKEKDTVTFNAPAEPGRYVFLCSFPGHYQVGMKGELIVE